METAADVVETGCSRGGVRWEEGEGGEERRVRYFLCVYEWTTS
jgi:hypothetical protein